MTISPNWIAAGLVATAAASVMAAINLAGPEAESGYPLPPDPTGQSISPSVAGKAGDNQVAAMAELLDREVEERLLLEDELEALQDRVARLESMFDDRNPETGSAAPASAAISGRGARNGITEEAFIAAGFTPDQAAFYRQRHDEVSMAQLYLRDQAEREGWLRSRRFVDEQRALRQQLQEMERGMDEDTYARYLYALGRPNQVGVRRVLVSSAADSAGIRDGDVLLRYDGQRVYQASDLRRATRSGETGEMVAVDILRDGQRIQTYVPRGPLGVNMSSDRVLPGG
ncbi:MAG: PDZ domain-containing protein [Gammaproteobacteria bacterium]|jgi:hypothetical protein